MPKHLLIVESPAKAKTIEKILGTDFVVKSSFGHVRDLIKDSKDKKAVDTQNNYKPAYEVSPDKRKVVNELKDWTKKVEDVWLATDEDREGEAISWHLAQVLGLDVRNTKRIVFREITKPAITKAVQNPRTIDVDLVNAQQARRILDRLVGFELSELLWKKVKPNLSAGRVQSVSVKLVVEREREIQAFNTKPFFKVSALFSVKAQGDKIVTLKAELHERFDLAKDAEAFLQKCVGAIYTIRDIQVKPLKRKPAAPFTTSTLQQEASRKMGFSVNRTMQTAQRLYEAGHITYMRTDSTSLSQTALTSIAAAIEQNYGKQYVHTRQYKTNKAGAQEAHEAIRPTYIEKQNVSGNSDEQRLYELIWKRTIASQMSDAELEKTDVHIGISTIAAADLVATGEVLMFDGFLKVYLESTDDDEDDDTKDVLPPLKVGQVLDFKEMQATERFTRPAPRYTEAALVKKLEELGIGRPSTYAPTIGRIMDPSRGYVVKENREGVQRQFAVYTLNKAGQISQKTSVENTGAEKQKLFPTDMGMVVVDFLDQYFDEIMDYGFTAEIENDLDRVAEGKKDWIETIDTIYKPFHELIKKTGDESERISGERVLGLDPKSGRSILVRIARTGKAVVQIGKPEELAEGEKPKYANLRHDQMMDSVTLEEVLPLFDLPKELGLYEGLDVTIGEGRYGPYIKYGEKYISLPKGEDPHEVTMERAQMLIGQKEQADAPIGTYQGKPITKGSGRFGPFVKWGTLYVSITKGSGFSLDNITEAGAIKLIEEKQHKEANKYIQQWEEEGIFIENGRWGAFIRMGKKDNFKLPKGADGKAMSNEEAATLSLEDVKKIIEGQGGKLPVKKAKAPAKKAPVKKTTAKK
jgi:DNA topoisomerase-1